MKTHPSNSWILFWSSATRFDRRNTSNGRGVRQVDRRKIEVVLNTGTKREIILNFTYPVRLAVPEKERKREMTLPLFSKV